MASRACVEHHSGAHITRIRGRGVRSPRYDGRVSDPASPPRAGVGIAAFFDVDNTIIRGASAFHIARGLKARGFFTFRDITRFAFEQLKYTLFGETQEQMDAIQNEALSIVKGWSVAEMAAIGEEVWDEVLALRIYEGTKAIMDDHRAHGHQVWLVTASPVEIGRLIARKLGATGALGTIAEHTGGYYTGRLIGGLLHGEAKAVAIGELAKTSNIDLSQSYAYGDSMNDAPMLSLVGRPCAINPDAKLQKQARRHGWPIEEFRNRRKSGRRGVVKASVTGSVWVTLAVTRGIKKTICAPFRRSGVGPEEAKEL